MSNINLFNNSWNEIVFEGRNKQYGAYQLRHDDGKTTLTAFFAGTLACGLLLSLAFLSPKNIVIPEKPLSDPIVVEAFIPPLAELEKEKEIIPAGSTEKSSQEQTKLVDPKIVDTHTTPVETPEITPDVVKTGANDNPGDGNGVIAIGNGSENGTGTGTGTTENTSTGTGGGIDDIVLRPDVKANFPGGIGSFTALVGKKFRTPEIAHLDKVTVLVSFVVEKDGSLTNITVTRDPGYGLGNEAIRVLKSIKTKWTPAEKSGTAVRTVFNMPITVKISER